MGHRGQADPKGGQHVSVGGQHIRVGGMYVLWGRGPCRWGLWVHNGGAQNPLVALEWPEGTGVGQVATQAGGGMESAKAAVRRVARCDRQVGGGDGHGVMDEQALASAG